LNIITARKKLSQNRFLKFQHKDMCECDNTPDDNTPDDNATDDNTPEDNTSGDNTQVQMTTPR
jgi:hypothetical protein